MASAHGDDSMQDEEVQIGDGSVVIAAITSCTNTSNPSVMIGGGAAGEARRRARPEDAPACQDEPCPWLPRRHRLPQRSRTDTIPRGARIPYCRLWMYDMHRRGNSCAARQWHLAAYRADAQKLAAQRCSPPTLMER